MKTSIRNFIGYCIANGLMLSGAVKKATKKIQQGENILCLCFHSPGKSFFESIITWLKKKGFHFIPVSDLERIASGKIAFPKGAVVITVDDGWQSNIDNIAPIAEKHNVPVTIFVTTDPVEKGNGYWWSYMFEARRKGLRKEPMQFFKDLSDDDRLKIVEETKQQININREALTVEQLKTISKNKNISIGSHTLTHPILTKCTAEKSADEITASKKILEGWTGIPVNHFAYPNGDFNKREIDILKTDGYTVAFSVEQTYITREKLDDLYRLPRLMIVENASLKENICRLLGIWVNKKLFELIIR